MFTGRFMLKQLAVLMCLTFLMAPLSGCLGATEEVVADNTSNPDDTSSDESIIVVQNDSTPTGPEPSPYDVVCPDGTQETIQWGAVTCAAPTVWHEQPVLAWVPVRMAGPAARSQVF